MACDACDVCGRAKESLLLEGLSVQKRKMRTKERKKKIDSNTTDYVYYESIKRDLDVNVDR